MGNSQAGRLRTWGPPLSELFEPQPWWSPGSGTLLQSLPSDLSRLIQFYFPNGIFVPYKTCEFPLNYALSCGFDDNRTTTMTVGHDGSILFASFNSRNSAIFRHPLRAINDPKPIMVNWPMKDSTGVETLPQGVISRMAVDPQGNVLILRAFSEEIDFFNPSGEFIKTVCTSSSLRIRSSSSLRIRSCSLITGSDYTAMVVNPRQGDIILSNGFLSRLEVIHPGEQKPHTTIGKPGKGQVEFLRPHGLAFDPSGNLHVCDKDNGRIQVLNSSYEFLREYGKDIQQPAQIVIDSGGKVVVSGTEDPFISIFDSTGILLTKFKWGIDAIRALCPISLCLDQKGNIVVATAEHIYFYRAELERNRSLHQAALHAEILKEYEEMKHPLSDLNRPVPLIYPPMNPQQLAEYYRQTGPPKVPWKDS
jgi:hypothetical protein